MTYLVTSPGGGPVSPAPPAGSVTYSTLDPSLQSALVPLRNRQINGQFRVTSRGADFTVGTAGVTDGQVTADCWRVNASGSNGARVAFSSDSVSLIRETGAGNVEVFSKYETRNWSDLVGKPMTLSWEQFRVGGASTIQGSVITTDAQTGFANGVVVMAKTASNTANQKWEKFSVTGTVPANSTQQGLYTSIVGLGVGTSAANQYMMVRNVQLEVGPVATPFEFRHIGLERMLCQRYLQAVSGYQMGQAYTTTNAFIVMPLQVPLTGPVTYIPGVASSLTNASAGSLPVTAITLNVVGNGTVEFLITVASGLIAGNATAWTGAGFLSGELA